METSTLPTLHRIAEVLKRTGLSRSAFYKVVTAGDLQVIKIGRSVRVSESELSRYITSLGR